jgi:hypothetical protein
MISVIQLEQHAMQSFLAIQVFKSMLYTAVQQVVALQSPTSLAPSSSYPPTTAGTPADRHPTYRGHTINGTNVG